MTRNGGATGKSEAKATAVSVARSGRVQLHLRLNEADAEMLKRIARDRDQTLSAVVRYLVRAFAKQRGYPELNTSPAAGSDA